MTRVRPRVVIVSTALAEAETAATRSLTREVGGVLMGVRVGDDVHVEDVVTVADPSSTGIRFLLRESAREEAIRRYRAERGKDPRIGYVGSWHSHLGSSGPSLIDRRTFQRELWSARDLLGMVVLTAGRGGWRPVAVVGRPRLKSRAAEVVVV